MQGIHLRKYGAATTINFERYEVDGVDLRVDAVHVAGDTKLMKDEGAEANTTNAFVDEGQGYSIALTATEMQAARLVLYVVDAATKAWLDKVIIIETYGNASAQHAVDLDDSVRAGLTALPNAVADAAGGLPISDAGGLDIDTKLANTNEVTAARMAALTDWIDGGRLDLLLDAIPTTAMRGTDGALTDKAGFSLSAAGTLAIWHEAVTNIVTASTIGKLLKDEVTSARMAVLTDWIDGGRLDLLLDAILVDTAAIADIPTVAEFNARTLVAASYALEATVAALNNLSTADIDARLAAINLDHLVGTATAIPAMPAGVFFDQLMRQAAGTYNRETDSLQALRDTAPMGTAMRGTDSAALASVATETRLAELDAANLPTDIAAIPTTAMRGTDSAALASVATEARLAELDAANLPSDVDAVLADTGTDGVVLAAGAVDAIYDELRADHVIQGSFGESFDGFEPGAAIAGTLSTTQMTTDLTEATDDHYNGRTIIWLTGALKRQASDITDYTGATKLLTFTAVTEAPAIGDRFLLY